MKKMKKNEKKRRKNEENEKKIGKGDRLVKLVDLDYHKLHLGIRKDPIK